MSWSRHGYENASYCISQTGRQPAMQSPTAEPRMPASASGMSTQRSGPKRSRRPAGAADVLAHHHDRIVARELDVQRVVDGFHEIELSHRGSSAAPRGRTQTTRAD